MNAGEYLANGVYLNKLYTLLDGQWVLSGVKTVVILKGAADVGVWSAIRPTVSPRLRVPTPPLLQPHILFITAYN